MKQIYFRRNLLFAFFITISTSLSAQDFTIIPSITAKMNYAAVNDQHNLAIVGGKEHYISTNQGNSWTEIDNGSGTGLYQVEGIEVVIVNSQTICMIGKRGNTPVIVRTTDGGSTWIETFATLGGSWVLKDIAMNGNTLLVTGLNGVYRSTDAGINWTYIPLTTANIAGSFIEYNGSSNSWITGGYTNNFHVSYDDGAAWQEVTSGFATSTVMTTSQTAGSVLLSKNMTSATQVVLLDDTNTEDTVATVPLNLVSVNNALCQKAEFLPNYGLLTHNNSIFFAVDTSNQHVYHLTYPLATIYRPRGFSLGATYGIAFATNDDGTLGRVFRIDLSQPASLVVPSYFNVPGPGPCAGDPIVAIPYADYADSVKWYINNALVSTANTLFYPTPAGIYTTYTIKLDTWYHGNMHTTTKQVVMTAPSAPHGFAYTVDTTACYGESLHVFIDPNPGSPANTAVKILYNGNLVFGPINMSFANINAYIPSVTVSGQLEIITYKTLYCDPSSDTVSMQIEVGPNLYDFDILTHDSVICTEVNPILSINGTDSLYSYDFFNTYSMNGFDASPHTVIPGNSTGTLSVEQYGLGPETYINSSTMEQTYGPMYMFLHLEITDTAGCSPSRVIDTIRIQRPTAYYELHSRSYLTGDTIHLSNAFITPNRLWSSPELDPAFISNETDTLPLIIADTTGLFSIELRNEPLAGCVDSVSHHIYYAEPAPVIDPPCEIVTPHVNERLHHVRIDPFGNIYEISAFMVTEEFHQPAYILRKNDPFGNMLWEKRAAEAAFWWDIDGVVIEEMDFDAQGNPVIVMWLHGTADYQDDYIDYHFTQATNAQQGACYVMKIDKTTGELIWRSNLGELSPSTLYTSARLTDVVVDGDWVHATTYSYNNLDFFTLKSADGSLINTTPIDFSVPANVDFIGPNFLFPTGSLGNSRQSYWSPQIDVLSTGEVIAIGNYNNIPVWNFPQLILDNSGSGIFAMKYHPNNGVYDVVNISQTGGSQFSEIGSYGATLPKMFVDKNDNITVTGSWDNVWRGLPQGLTVSVLDSVLPMETGTFVMNMDSDYQLNWITTGLHSNIEDLAYVPATGEIYMTCKTQDNFALMNNATVIMSGEDRTYNLSYTHLPHPEYPWLNYPQNSFFLSRLDASGVPLSMKQFSFISAPNYGYILQRLATTACGDLAIFNGSWYGDGELEIDGQTYTLDSTLVFLNYSGCASDDCSYLNADDSLELCAVNGTINVQLSDYYNLSSVTYDIIENGVMVETGQTATVEDGLFSFPVPSSANNDFILIFTSPNADTMTVAYEDILIDFGTLSEDTVCTYGVPVMLGNGTPAGGVYSGPGVSGSQFDPAVTGAGEQLLSYTYTNNNGCVAIANAEVYVDECLGLSSSILNTFQAYPNPFTDELQIVISGPIMTHPELILRDYTGRIVYSASLFGESTTIQLDRLTAGNYLLEIIDGDRCEHREHLVKM